jgi:RNA polymerase subunit RPABC4/transcription elongation factor Spt4
MYCKNCGETLNENQDICLNCGVEKGSGKVFCENCGGAVNDTDTKCPSCEFSTVSVTKAETEANKSMIFGIISVIAGVSSLLLQATYFLVSFFIDLSILVYPAALLLSLAGVILAIIAFRKKENKIFRTIGLIVSIITLTAILLLILIKIILSIICIIVAIIILFMYIFGIITI